MAIKTLLDKLDDVEESLRTHYVEKDGKFHLDLVDVGNLPIVASLKNEAAQNRIKARDAEAKLVPWATLGEFAEVQGKLDKYPELELAAAGKMDDAKINALVETRVVAKLAPITRERDTLVEENKGLKATNEMLEGEKRSAKIATAIRSAAASAKMLPTAIEDALLLGERIFEINDAGSIVVRDQVGYTPGVDPTVWLAEMKDKRGHWWGATVGGGAGGSSGSSSSGENPWSLAGWNLTKQSQIYKENPDRAKQLAQIAGTTLTGGKPKK